MHTSFFFCFIQPDKFVHSLVLFVQGLGKLSSLGLSNWNHPRSGSYFKKKTYSIRQLIDILFTEDTENNGRSRAMSMEKMDTPNVRRLSNTAKKDWRREILIYYLDLDV